MNKKHVQNRKSLIIALLSYLLLASKKVQEAKELQGTRKRYVGVRLVVAAKRICVLWFVSSPSSSSSSCPSSFFSSSPFIYSAVGLAYGKKFTEEEKLAVSLLHRFHLYQYCSLPPTLSSLQPDPFKLKTGGLVDLKEISGTDLEGYVTY